MEKDGEERIGEREEGGERSFVASLMAHAGLIYRNSQAFKSISSRNIVLSTTAKVSCSSNEFIEGDVEDDIKCGPVCGGVSSLNR